MAKPLPIDQSLMASTRPCCSASVRCGGYSPLVNEAISKLLGNAEAKQCDVPYSGEEQVFAGDEDMGVFFCCCGFALKKMVKVGRSEGSE
jgi:hypothetical protein